MIEYFLPSAQRWLLFTGTLLLIGIPAWRSFVRPRVERVSEMAARALDMKVIRTGLFLSLVLLLVWGLRLQVQLLGFRDPFVPMSEDLRILILETSWGHVWIAQGILLAAMAALFGLVAGETKRISMRSAVLWTGTILLVLTLSLSSHAMSVSSNRAVAVMADVLHMLSAGLWIGTLTLILILMRLPDKSMPHTILAVQLRAFSPLAMVSVAVLVSMGMYMTATQLTEIRNLWTSSYGRTLTAKITAAAVALVLGFLNWRRGLPTLDSEEGSCAVYRRATVEVGVVALILLFTAILTGQTLPR